MRQLILIIGILCIAVSIIGLALYSKPEPPKVVYVPSSTPVSTPVLIPATPAPTRALPMTIIQVGAGEWDVFIPEADKWFDTRIPVIVNQYVSIIAQGIGQPNSQVKIGGRVLYNQPGNTFSIYTYEWCDQKFPYDLRDTIKFRMEEGEPRIFHFKVNHFTASNCASDFGHTFSDPEAHIAGHRAVIEWWDTRAASLGRK